MVRSKSIVYRRSPYLQSGANQTTCVIWHSLLGWPLEVSLDTLEFLNAFDRPRTVVGVLGGQPTQEERELCQLFIDRLYLVPAAADPRAIAMAELERRRPASDHGHRIRYLELIMTEACNLRCRYCFHFRSNGEQSLRRLTVRPLSFELGRRAIDEYFSQLRRNGVTQAVVNFGVGEPLLAWPRVREFMEYARASAVPDLELSFTLNTNLTRLTVPIAQVLKQEGVTIATSLDGLEVANDAVRITRNGSGTFGAITASLDLLEQIGWPVNGVAVTVSQDNWPTFDNGQLDWAQFRRLTQVRVDPDVLSLFDVPVPAIAERLLQLRRDAATRGIIVAGFWSRPFENLTNDGISESIGFCGAVSGRSMCVAPGGQVYACGYSSRPLGHIVDGPELFGIDQRYHQLLAERRTGHVERCRECPIESACGGGCEVAAECADRSGQLFDRRVCQLYVSLTTQLLLDHIQQAGHVPNL